MEATLVGRPASGHSISATIAVPGAAIAARKSSHRSCAGQASSGTKAEASRSSVGQVNKRRAGTGGGYKDLSPAISGLPLSFAIPGATG